MDNYQIIRVEVNGLVYNKNVKTTTTLLEFLREELKLKGPKKGCDNGQCGSCSVIMNDEIVYSCHVLAVQANDSKVITVEGMALEDKLHPIQQALVEEGAIQCGFCTPGMVLAIKKLLDKHPDPTESQIKYYLSGNICRCTGYVKIASAAKKASKTMLGN